MAEPIKPVLSVIDSIPSIETTGQRIAAEQGSFKDMLQTLQPGDMNLPNYAQSEIVPYDSAKRYFGQEGYRGSESEDFYAQQQSAVGNIGRFLATSIMKTPVKFANGLTDLFGLIGEGARVSVTGDKFSFDNVVNNNVSKWLSELDESIGGEGGPLTTFRSRDYENNNIFHNLLYNPTEFLGSSFNDATAFLLSAILPGALISKLGAGIKLGKTVSKLAWANKAGNASEFGTAAGIAAKAFKNMDYATAVMYNTAVESMAEARGVKNSLYDEFIKQGKTDKEAQMLSDQGAQNAFLHNLWATAVPNMFEMSWIFKGGLGRNMKKAGTEVAALTGKDITSKFVRNIPRAIVAEGGQELVQLGISKAQDRMIKGELSPTFIGQFSDIWDEIKANATTKEGMENWVTGGLLGIFGSAGSSIGDYTSLKKDTTLNARVAQVNSFTPKTIGKSISSLYKSKIEDGKESIQTKENGEPEIDADELYKGLQYMSNLEMAGQLQEHAQLTGDEVKFNIGQDIALREMALFHFNDNMGDMLINKIRAATQLNDEELADMGVVTPEDKTRFRQNIESQLASVFKLKKRYDSIQSIYGGVTVNKKDENGNTVKVPFDIDALFREASFQDIIKDQLSELTLQKQELSSDIINEEGEEAQDPLVKAGIVKLTKQISSLERELTQSKKRLTELTTNPQKISREQVIAHVINAQKAAEDKKTEEETTTETPPPPDTTPKSEVTDAEYDAFLKGELPADVLARIAGKMKKMQDLDARESEIAKAKSAEIAELLKEPVEEEEKKEDKEEVKEEKPVEYKVGTVITAVAAPLATSKIQPGTKIKIIGIEDEDYLILVGEENLNLTEAQARKRENGTIMVVLKGALDIITGKRKKTVSEVKKENKDILNNAVGQVFTLVAPLTKKGPLQPGVKIKVIRKDEEDNYLVVAGEENFDKSEAQLRKEDLLRSIGRAGMRTILGLKDKVKEEKKEETPPPPPPPPPVVGGKMSNLNPVNFWSPLWQATEQMRLSMLNLVKSVPIEEIESKLSVEVYDDPVKQNEADVQLSRIQANDKDAMPYPVKGYPKLFQTKNMKQVVIRYDSATVVGVVPFQDLYFWSWDNKWEKIDSTISKDNFTGLFGNPEGYDAFIEGLKFIETFRNKIKSKGTGRHKLDAEYSPRIFVGSLLLEKEISNRPLLKDLEFNKLKVGDEEVTTIVEVVEDKGELKFQVIRPTVLQSAAHAKVKELLKDELIKGKLSTKGRYKMLVSNPNGEVDVILARPKDLEAADTKAILGELKAQLETLEPIIKKVKNVPTGEIASKLSNEEKVINTEFNKSLNEKIYIAEQKYKDATFTLSLSPVGLLRLRMYSDEEKKEAFLSADDVRTATSLQELLDKFADQKAYKGILSKGSLSVKNNIPTSDAVTEDELLTMLTGAVQKPVYAKVTLSFDKSPGTRKAGSKQEAEAKTTPEAKPAEVKPVENGKDKSIDDLRAELAAEKDPKKIILLQQEIYSKEIDLFTAKLDGLDIDPSESNEPGDTPFKLNEGPANGKMDEQQAVKYLRDILPDFVSVTVADKLAAAVSNNFEVMGYLKNSGIYLSRNATPGTPYHEAFHAVFRLLLPDSEITTLLDQGHKKLVRTKNKTLSAMVKEAVERIPAYKKMSPSEVRERVIEEFLADDFMSWKLKGSSFWGKVWQKLQQFLNWIIGNTDDLTAIYQRIDMGKYRFSNIAENRFNEVLGIPEIAYQLIPYAAPKLYEENGVKKYKTFNLSARESGEIISRVAITAMMMKEKHPDYSIDELITATLDEFDALYSPLSTFNANADADKLKKLGEAPEFFIYHAPPVREIIAKESKKYLVAYLAANLEDEDAEMDRQEEGKTTSDYDKNAEEFGGFRTLPLFMRTYISSTYEEMKNYFGEPILLPNGLSVVRPVNPSKVYYGLLRAASNSTSAENLLQRAILFGRQNKDAGFFISKLVKDSGLDTEAVIKDGQIRYGEKSNPQLLQKFLKAFNKIRANRWVILDGEKNEKKWIPANSKNVDRQQVDQWRTNYDRISESARKDVNIQGLTAYFNPKELVKFSDDRLQEIVSDIKFSMSRLGIELSDGYIRYSLLKPRYDKSIETSKEYAENDFISEEQFYEVDRQLIPDEYLLGNHLMNIEYANRKGNPFLRAVTQEDDGQGGTVEKIDGKMGAHVHLMKVAMGNSYFDETVGESSYVNAEGKVVYMHVDPRIVDLFSLDMRNPKIRQQYFENGGRYGQEHIYNKYDKEWVTENFLTTHPDADAIFDNFKYGYAEGISGTAEESVYGNMTDAQFAAFVINQSLIGYDTVKGKNGNIILIPTLTRVFETSKTGYLAYLPYNASFYKGGRISEEATDALLKDVTREFERIRRAKAESLQFKELYEQWKAGNADIETIKGRIYNYHYTFKESVDAEGNPVSEIVWTGRGHKFSDDVSRMLPAELLKKMSEAESLDSLTKEIRIELRKFAESGIDDFIEKLIERGQLKRGSEGKIVVASGSSLAKDIKGVVTSEDGVNALDMSTTDIRGNIGKLWVNHFINARAFNYLLSGDPALTYKNTEDAFKRAKSFAGAIQSFENASEVKGDTFNVGIIREPKTKAMVAHPKTGETAIIDSADAQLWMTPKGLEKILKGLGRMTPKAKEVLDKIKSGQPVPLEDVLGKDGLVTGDNPMFNAMKALYADGKAYFKMSVVLLQRDMTSWFDGERYQPLRGWEWFHNLLDAMERTDTHMAGPQSMSKMFSPDVAFDNEGFSDLISHPYDARYFGLQMENPSNKREVNLWTQGIQVLDSEQKDDDSIMVEYAGGIVPLSELRQVYRQLMANRISNNFITARNELFKMSDPASIDGGEVMEMDMKSFYKKVGDILDISGADPQTKEFFSLSEAGDPKYNLNLPIVRQEAMKHFVNMFKKGVMRQKLPGYALTLTSSHNVKLLREVTEVTKDGRIKSMRVIRRDELKTNPRAFAELEVPTGYHNIQRERSATVGMIFEDRLIFSVDEFDSEDNVIGFYSEMLMPAHHKELGMLRPGDAVPMEVAKTINSRIPLQDKHSMMSTRIVDFLPANLGSTAMFPAEIVWLSGADFDVDKVYTVSNDWYVKNGTFYKYGDATTPEGRYEEYLMWQKKNNKFVKKYLKEDTVENKDEAVALLFGDSDRILIENALAKLRLPSSQAEYLAFNGEANTGVLNNRLVDVFHGMITNNGIRDIAMTPAELTDLKELENEFPGIFEVVNKFPADTLNSFVFTKTANDTGKNNIGIDVSMEMAYTALRKANPAVHDSYHYFMDGEKIDSFGKDTVADGKNTRVMHLVSMLVSAATDEAKELLNAKYNLNENTVKLTMQMVMQGVPLRSAVAFVNHPIIRTAAKKDYLDIKDVKNELKKYATQLKLDYAGHPSLKNMPETAQRSLTFDELKTAIEIGKRQTVIAAARESDRKGMRKSLSGDPAQLMQTANNLVMVLDPLLRMNYYMGVVSRVVGLTKGVESNFESIDNITGNLDWLSGKKLKNQPAPFDLSEVFNPAVQATGYEDKISKANIQVAQGISKIGGKVFYELTPTFISQFSKIEATLNEWAFVKKEGREKLQAVKKDFHTYLLLTAYFNFLSKKGALRDTLDYSLLYDSINKPAITAIVKDAMGEFSDNGFLQYVLPVSTTSRINNKEQETDMNRKGYNYLESKTFGRTREDMIQSLSAEFWNLYQSGGKGKRAALAILDYLTMKDGLQFKSGSPIKLLPADIFTTHSSVADIIAKLYGATSQKDIDETAIILKDYGFGEVELKGTIEEQRKALGTLLFGRNFAFMWNSFVDVLARNVNNKDLVKRRWMQLFSSEGSPFKLVGPEKQENSMIRVTAPTSTEGIKKLEDKKWEYFEETGDVEFPRYIHHFEQGEIELGDFSRIYRLTKVTVDGKEYTNLEDIMRLGDQFGGPIWGTNALYTAVEPTGTQGISYIADSIKLFDPSRTSQPTQSQLFSVIRERIRTNQSQDELVKFNQAKQRGIAQLNQGEYDSVLKGKTREYYLEKMNGAKTMSDLINIKKELCS